MDFGFSEEQDLLRDQVRKFLDDNCSLEVVRELASSSAGYSAEHWKQLGELGFLGLALPEAYGGAGLGWADLVVLLEETGRSLFPSPLVSTLLAGLLIDEIGDAQQKERWLPGIAAGSSIATVAVLEESDVPGPAGVALRGEREGDSWILQGEKRFVVDACQADLFVVAFRTGDAAGDIAFALVEANAPGVSSVEIPTLDRTRRVGHLRLDGVRVEPAARLGEGANAAGALSAHLDRGAAAVAAEAVGVIEGALDITVQFAKDRVQFGQPIGHFQGVKHPLAEIYVDLESLKSLVYYAAWALDESPEDVPLAVAEAKAFAARAVTRAGIDAIQLHGAVGYTEEYDIQLYLKRSKWSRMLFGDEDHHHDRIAAICGY
jgi:alkylation response protein AidB-like acyl-CoA dehydrogenase